ncbi:MAG TPA: hypothetical protein PLY16_03435 [Candidatus Saccharibacteria bacterium]|nr:hypothetical protein [Candidatus Saccharibacteria bacterium]
MMTGEENSKTSLESYQQLIKERERIDHELFQARINVRAKVLQQVKKLIEEFNITPSELRKYLKPKRRASKKAASKTRSTRKKSTA